MRNACIESSSRFELPIRKVILRRVGRGRHYAAEIAPGAIWKSHLISACCGFPFDCGSVSDGQYQDVCAWAAQGGDTELNIAESGNVADAPHDVRARSNFLLE